MIANRISVYLLWLTIIKSTLSAMVAQDRVIEMIQQAQHQLPDVSNLQSELRVLENRQILDLALPLSLQFGVLHVTDSTSRDMSLPKWQAMLRALGGDREILKRFAQLRPSFNELENQVGQQQDGQQEINQIFDQLAEIETSVKNSWSRLWPKLKSSVQVVSNLYDWFDRYQRNAAVVNERTLRDYAETVHGQDGLTTSQAIEAIHKVVCPLDMASTSDDDDINLETKNKSTTCSSGAFEVLETALAQAKDMFTCSTSKSPQQLVYDLYTILALTDAKGYAMMQFSWMLLRLYGKGNYTLESDMARANFEHRMIRKAQAASSVLSHLPTWIWKCDPPPSKHVENETYIQFTELLQGYIVNEVDLNQDNTCKESCSAYTNSQEKGCFDKKFCSVSRRCPNGRLYNCGFVEADSTVCSTNVTGRRYDWVEYKSGRTFGQKSECTSSTGNSMHRVDSWWRWLFWHCSYCTCLCDQPGLKSDRYISLESITTDTTNYLVTGVRFVKKNRIVHIQIQEGEALPKGMVNQSTVRWRAIKPILIPKYKEDSLEDGSGYATLRYEERALDLDDLVAPTGHAITGLRFRKLGGHLNLEIQASPTNFETGQVDSERATWISNDNTPAAEVNPRKKMPLLSPDVPTRSTDPSVPDSVADTYIEFQASSLEKDVSQTTVPFLDATPVTPNPPTWLTGIGIYHKGQPGYGGFLAFRVSTYNMSDHLAIPLEDSSFHDGRGGN